MDDELLVVFIYERVQYPITAFVIVATEVTCCDILSSH